MKYSTRIFLISSSLGLMIFCLPIFFIGYFVDDAVYVLTAKSFWPGAAAPSPFLVSPADILPGYPLVLAPFVQMLGATSPVLKLTSIVWMLCALLIFWRLAQDHFEPRPALIVWALFAFNSTVARYSGTLMAEPFFILVSVSAVWTWTKTGRTASILAVFLLAYATLIRPQGILLAGAVILSELVTRTINWPRVAAGFLSLLPYIVLMVANGILYGTTSSYWAHIQDFSSHMLQLYGTSFHSLVTLIGLEVMYAAVPLQHHYLKMAEALFLLAGLFVPILFAGFYFWKRTPIRISFLYLLISILSLPLWFGQDARYALVLIPFLAFVCCAGWAEFLKLNPHSFLKILAGSFLVLWIGFQARSHWGNIQEALGSEVVSRAESTKTYGFIRSQLSPADFILTAQAPTVELYTGVRAVRLFVSKSEAEFQASLDRLNIRFILLRAEALVPTVAGSPEREIPKNIRTWVQDNQKFKLIFNDEAEKSKIYLRIAKI